VLVVVVIVAVIVVTRIMIIARPVVVCFPTPLRRSGRMLVTVGGPRGRGMHVIPIVVVMVVVVTRTWLRVLLFSGFVHRRDPPPRR